MLSERKAQRLVRNARSVARLVGAIGKELARGGSTLVELEQRATDGRLDALVEALRTFGDADLRESLPTAALARSRHDLMALCLAHGFLPADVVQQVVFFHAAGRTDQAHALDPDDSLLATGYAATARRDRTQAAAYRRARVG